MKAGSMGTVRFVVWLTGTACGGAVSACGSGPTDARYVLWEPGVTLPGAAECEALEGIRHEVIKQREPEADGFNWLHGVAVCWHEGRLYASFGHNRGGENTAGEVARGRVSDDGGRTWGPVFTIDDGVEENPAVSHGVLLSHRGTLWAFCGSFFNFREKMHMRAYVLDEDRNAWVRKGVAAGDGFWPTGEPRKMDDGNWVVAGFRVEGRVPAAVAISRGEDFTRWDVVRIPLAGDLGPIWGESAVIVAGREILNIARCSKALPAALAAVSTDYGRTWSEMAPANLPMVDSKPFAGTLSTGQRYLVGTTTADSGNRRRPLTIAVTEPGGKRFRRVFRIRGAVHGGPGESHPNARLSYPYAVEHEGRLYVAFSNDGGRGGNRNSAELAVIPVEALGFRPFRCAR